MTTSDPFVGKVIDGRYEIQARVGDGGMGVVYKARQISIDRVIALKVLNQEMAQDPTWVQRFYNEARACSRLQHPNTIRMFDFGQTQGEGRLFMTMEFLDGISLRDALQKGPLAPQRVVKILIQCCASLAEAHSIGIIHRDIKPDNVFLLNMAGSPDFVKLLDFSVAKLLEGDRMKTQAGVVFGTPQYMSPEQGRGLPLDARSDLYALGILAFEMLSGMVPFHDENPMNVIQMHLSAGVPPMPDHVPYSVQQIVRRALEKDAGRRYQSAGEMMQHCQQVFAELTQGAMSIGAGGMPRTMVPGQPAPLPGLPPQHAQHGVAPYGHGMPQHPGQAPHGHAPMQPPHAQYAHAQHPHAPAQHPHAAMQHPHAAMQHPHAQMPHAHAPMQQPYAAASPQQKTMIAQPSPFAGGAPVPQMQSGLAQPPGGFVSASPQQKTIVAGMTAPVVPQPYPGGHAPPPGMAPPAAPAKTMVLQPSEGVVSLARTGQGLPPAGPMAGTPQGATTLFWIVSMLIGIGIGALAYVIVLQTM